MPEILPWNNAFNAGAGSAGGISVSGMQLPSGDTSGGGAFMNALNAGRQARASRQDMVDKQEQMALAREQMGLTRERFNYDMAKETTNMLMKQRELSEDKLLGQVIRNNVDTETGIIDWTGVAADGAKEELLAGRMPDLIKMVVEGNKADAEGINERFTAEITKARGLAQLGFALKETKGEGNHYNPGLVGNAIAKAIATGLLPPEEGKALIGKFKKEGPEFDAQVEGLTSWWTNAADLTAEMQKRMFGTNIPVNQEGQTAFQTEKIGPNGITMSPTLGPDNQPAVFPDVPTFAERYREGKRINERGEEVPVLEDMLSTEQGQVPSQAPSAGISPSQAPATTLRRPLDPVVSAAVVKQEDAFGEMYKQVNLDADKTVSRKQAVETAMEALKEFTPGAFMGLRTATGSAVSLFSTKLADAIAGGSLAGAEVFAAQAYKEAFSAIRDANATNRDLSGPELVASKASTFGPSAQPEANEALIKFAVLAITYHESKQQFMAQYKAGYDADPRSAKARKYDLQDAQAKFSKLWEKKKASIRESWAE